MTINSLRWANVEETGVIVNEITYVPLEIKNSKVKSTARKTLVKDITEYLKTNSIQPYVEPTPVEYIDPLVARIDALEVRLAAVEEVIPPGQLT